jgi:membrane protease YdiL (CAAX protease family)
MALSGVFFQRHAQAHSEMLQLHPNVVPLYLYLIAMEAGLFFYVSRAGLRRAGIKASELIGGRWTNAKDVLVDAVLALGLWGCWRLIEASWIRWLGPGHAKSIQTLLPRGPLEILLWIGVSISAGICEEFVFRGYFQKQFAVFTHSRWIALLLQSLLFGIAHGYQGIQACLRISVFGLLYGSLALWRNSLRPGMMAHAASDILSGIFGI